jgi:hypothetical protein
MSLGGNGGNDGFTINRGSYRLQDTLWSGRESAYLGQNYVSHGFKLNNGSQDTFILPKVANRNGVYHSRREVTDIEAHKLYNPHMWRTELEATYGKENVTSSTLQRPGTRGYYLAGTKDIKSGIVYDIRSNPDFTSVMTYEAFLQPKEFYNKSRTYHMRAATRKLRTDIQSGNVDATKFTNTQLIDIIRGKAKIENYTWHHDQQARRMQLIDSDDHNKAPHSGSISLMEK